MLIWAKFKSNLIHITSSSSSSHPAWPGHLVSILIALATTEMDEGTTTKAGQGILKRAEEILTVPAAGTPLRPLITAARESAQSLITQTNSGVRDLAETVTNEITDQVVVKPPKGFDDVLSGARIRPDLKFAAIVGLTALVSSRFGARSLVRNTTVVSLISTIAIFPDSVSKSVSTLSSKVTSTLGRE